MSDYNLAILILVIVIMAVIIIVMAAQSMANDVSSGPIHQWSPRRWMQTPYYAHGGGPNTGMYY